jgi:uncharacterized membrane protein YjfL (UPF0719 family)
VEIWTIAVVVSLSGALGGFVNAFLTGSLHLPRRTEDRYAPGWIGNVVVGAVVAFLLWDLYDPSSTAAVIGEGSSNAKGILTIAEVAGSIVVGIGAARLLSSGVEKKGLVNLKLR